MDQTRTTVCKLATELSAQYDWAVREQTGAPLHPPVWEVIGDASLPNLSEADCRVMALHWPHVSNCGALVAFTPPVS